MCNFCIFHNIIPANFFSCLHLFKLFNKLEYVIVFLQQIHTLIQSLHFSGIDIKTINSLESWSEGIVVVVSGSVRSKYFSGWRKFVQTFFLAPQEKGYFVMNDIFHFVSEEVINHLPPPVVAGQKDDFQPISSTSPELLGITS